jgi:hypothetical protein
MSPVLLFVALPSPAVPFLVRIAYCLPLPSPHLSLLAMFYDLIACSDVIYDSFPLLYGSVPTSKNDVVKGAQWRFTGKRDTRYIFNSGNPV